MKAFFVVVSLLLVSLMACTLPVTKVEDPFVEFGCDEEGYCTKSLTNIMAVTFKKGDLELKNVRVYTFDYEGDAPTEYRIATGSSVTKRFFYVDGVANVKPLPNQIIVLKMDDAEWSDLEAEFIEIANGFEDFINSSGDVGHFPST
jgi:hypothetical protein